MPASSATRPAGPGTLLARVCTAMRRQPVRRSSERRWVAGAADGLARQLRIDPVIVRVGVVCLTFLMGAGVCVYLLAWVFVPTDDDRIVVEEAVRDHRPAAVALCVAAALGIAAVVFPQNGSPGALAPLIVLGAVGWYLFRPGGPGRRDGTQRRRSASDHHVDQHGHPHDDRPWGHVVKDRRPGETARPNGSRAGRVLSEERFPAHATEPSRPHPDVSRPWLHWVLVVAVAGLAAGAIHLLQAGLEMRQAGRPVLDTAAALAAVASIGLVQGVRGRRAAAPTIAAICLVLGLTPVALADRAEQRHALSTEHHSASSTEPRSVDQLAPSYEVTGAEQTLDLTGLTAADLGGHRVSIRATTAEVDIVLPDGLRTQVSTDLAVSALSWDVGEATGRRESLTDRRPLSVGPTNAPTLTLFVEGRAAQVRILDAHAAQGGES